MADDDALDDADRCLLRDSALLALSRPDAAGYLSRRAALHGWYRHWFSLHGSQLNYYDVTPRGRGPLAGSISLFRNRTTVSASPKRPRELDLVDFAGKTHALRADSDAQLHWWVQVFAIARNKIPPAKPIAPPPAPLASKDSSGAGSGSGGGAVAAGGVASAPSPGAAAGDAAGVRKSTSLSGDGAEDLSQTSARAAASAAAADAFSSAASGASGVGSAVRDANDDGKAGAAEGVGATRGDAAATAPPVMAKSGSLPSTAVDEHLPVDHVLCVVHGIGVSEQILAENIKSLQESYADIAAKIFPDLSFRVEILVVRWRNALTDLDVHRKLQACVPVPPNPTGESNPLRQFMVQRIIDYVYYTHARYRHNIMREITKQLNENMADFRRRRPDFQGHISIFAHSLGAALCYDLLVRRARDDQALLAAEGMRLDFQAANLFLAGSPLGTFLHLDPSLALGTNIRSLPFRVYNMFHPHDPIATRLEPFIEERFVGVRPIVVPYWINLGIRSSTTEWLGNLWTGGGSKKDKAAGASKATENGAGADATVKGRENGKSGKPVAQSEGSVPLLGVESVSAPGNMQSSSAKIGLGVGSEGAAALTVSTLAMPSSEDGGIIGAEGTPVRYFPEKAQEEIIAVTQLEHRFDFVLQLSSTMEEVSTSWSALRAHSEYWGNRDMMLLIMSSMIKTTHGIPDNVSRMPSLEVDQHLIDSRVHEKATRLGRGWADDDPVDGGSRRGQAVGRGEPKEEVQTLADGVGEFVDKIVEESAAMHELMLQHPNMRMRQGGITRSTSKVTTDGVSNGGTNPTQVRRVGSYGGWTSYIPWFGREGSFTAASSSSEGDERGSGANEAAKAPSSRARSKSGNLREVQNNGSRSRDGLRKAWSGEN